ncbi:MAG: hypothetical protein MI975_11280, partial [Cytophagales bacterium]|nr:hypothetical protein [Cytophagales bacterium]
NFVCMKKDLGGFSSNWKNYARVVEATKMAGKFPFVVIAMDVFHDIRKGSSIYNKESTVKRFFAGLIAGLGIWSHYYLLMYPKIIGGRIKRSIVRKK